MTKLSVSTVSTSVLILQLCQPSATVPAEAGLEPPPAPRPGRTGARSSCSRKRHRCSPNRAGTDLPPQSRRGGLGWDQLFCPGCLFTVQWRSSLQAGYELSTLHCSQHCQTVTHTMSYSLFIKLFRIIRSISVTFNLLCQEAAAAHSEEAEESGDKVNPVSSL